MRPNVISSQTFRASSLNVYASTYVGVYSKRCFSLRTKLSQRYRPYVNKPPNRATPNPNHPDDTFPMERVPVNVPVDTHGIIDRAQGPKAEAIKNILSVPALVVQRQLEYLNIFAGYEQANKYHLMDPECRLLGYLIEEDLTFGQSIIRQIAGAKRPFNATVLDTQGNELLKIQRPFAWWMSKVQIRLAPDVTLSGELKENEHEKNVNLVTQDTEAQSLGHLVGEAKQKWNLTQRRYDQYEVRDQNGHEHLQLFATMDAPALSWNFDMKNKESQIIGTVSRNFRGFATEIFTDSGEYVIRFDGAHRRALESQLRQGITGNAQHNHNHDKPNHSVLTPSHLKPKPLDTEIPQDLVNQLPAITLDQRGVMLATAISIDIDYFSRHSHGIAGSGVPFLLPMPIPGLGYPTGAPPLGAGEIPAAGDPLADAATLAGASALEETAHDGFLPYSTIEERWRDRSFDRADQYYPYGQDLSNIHSNSDTPPTDTPSMGNSNPTPDFNPKLDKNNDFFKDPSDGFLDESNPFQDDDPFDGGGF